MMKLIGGLLVILATSWLGFTFAGRVRDRPKQLRQLRSYLAILKTEIEYGTRPLAEACANIASQEETAVSRLFQASADQLLKGDGSSTYECFRRAIEQEWQRTALQQSEQTVLLQLCQVLGSSDRQDQAHHLTMACNQLELEENRAREEQDRYEKMYKTMGVLTGVLLVILMI
ncbi:stage III sporulation protein AB [Laceyella sacchari]|uniref:Stage III sporulation protein AB n=2 Tax=Laceyella TaxID=292635 RepID=A0AA46AGK5_9BACL|nr:MULTISPECIES: stage III sporulation protein SpoIIIAB [Laceyella]AUS08526.1 stage III sporulation protein AB [Laceyella sacchari]PRZ13052.1 stage III sporulation protein AB [Laceyella sediminis]SMP28732.1 stage III sporulation protein AB [Laceyella tengchongensis]